MLNKTQVSGICLVSNFLIFIRIEERHTQKHPSRLHVLPNGSTEGVPYKVAELEPPEQCNGKQFTT